MNNTNHRTVAAVILLILMSGCPQETPQTPPISCPPSSSKSNLSVMTYNLHVFEIGSALTEAPILKHFFGDAVNFFLHASSSNPVDFLDAERANQVAKAVLSQENPPDIIVFTEVWDRTIGKELKSKLAKVYPFHFHPEAESDLFRGQVFGSGLELFSKYPLIPGTGRFTPYSKLDGADASTLKGIGQISIQVCNGPKLTVFLTHTQAVYTSEQGAEKTTLDNIHQLGALVNDYREANPGEGILIVGDLNIPDDGEAYSQMTNALKSVDAYRHFYPDASRHPGFTYDEETNALIKVFTQVDPNKAIRQRLDYVFFDQGGPIRGVVNVEDGNPSLEPTDSRLKKRFHFESSGSAKKIPLSDHYPVRIDFSLDGVLLSETPLS